MSGRPMGAHVSPGNPIADANAIGATAIQLFLSNPQSWKKPNPRQDADQLTGWDGLIYVHSPYLVNLVAEPSRIRIPSRKILQDTCDAATDVGAAGVVVHGGHVSQEEDIEVAFPRWRKALEAVETTVPILIENTAGGDNAVVRSLETTRRLWEALGDLSPGFVLDTCHAWAGGEDLDGIVERAIDATGRIDLIHCNDSRDALDSRRDRHANLGDGEIPEELLVNVLRSVDAPIIVETPNGDGGHARDIAWIRDRL